MYRSNNFFRNAFTKFITRHDSDYANYLFRFEIEQVIRDEIARLTDGNDVVLNDYDIIALYDDVLEQTSTVRDFDLLSTMLSGSCNAQCAAGTAAEELRAIVTPEMRQTDPAVYALIEPTIGKILWYVHPLIESIINWTNGLPTELAVRRMVRFFYGHEWRHAVQSIYTAENGRDEDATRIMKISIDDDISSMSICQYNHIPSEVDADCAGYFFMLSKEEKEHE